MANKMTNRKALTAAISVMRNLGANPATNTITIDKTVFNVSDVVDKLESMAAALDNKSAGATRKPTAKQTENIGFRGNIMEFLRENPNRLLTCTEIGKEVAELNGMNNQRISALMKPLVEGGEVVKTSVKGKTLFQLAKSADEDDLVQALPRELEV